MRNHVYFSQINLLVLWVAPAALGTRSSEASVFIALHCRSWALWAQFEVLHSSSHQNGIVVNMLIEPAYLLTCQNTVRINIARMLGGCT